MTLTKADLIDAIYNQLDLPKTRSSKVVESLIAIIKRTLENGEDILITGFGKFYVKEKRKRKGRNPHTREDVMLDERKVVTFKCSGVLRNKINRERRQHSRINERLQFKVKAEDFDLATETINLSCLGAYCQLNRHIPLMTSLKIALALPYGDHGNGFDYVECIGVVVRVEEVLSETNMDSVYNTAIYFNEIEESEKEKIADFFQKHQRKEIGIPEQSSCIEPT
jgi:integration host factor subunit alpha